MDPSPEPSHSPVLSHLATLIGGLIGGSGLVGLWLKLKHDWNKTLLEELREVQDKEFERLQKRIERNEERITHIETERDVYRDQCTELQVANQELKTMNRQLETALETASATANQMERQNMDLTKRNKALEQLSEKLMEHRERDESRIAEVIRKNTLCEEEIKRMESALAKAGIQVEE